MARQKKIVRYRPNSPMPSLDMAIKLMKSSDPRWTDLSYVTESISLLPQGEAASATHYLRNIKHDMDNGWNPSDGWHEDWRAKRIYRLIWPSTELYTKLNDAFLKEYSEREDLQEIYQLAFQSGYWFYDRHGNHHSRDKAIEYGWDKVPETYMMYYGLIDRCTEAKKKIELARPTSFQAGDMVLLRPAFVGKDVDPYRISYYSEDYRKGLRTPDENTQRIGTIISITEKTGSWRAGKGSKLIKVWWVGKDGHVDIEERHLKWYMRPTLKNGLKTRE